MKEQMLPTDRTRLQRMPARGMFDRAEIYRILDEGLVCHVGFAVAGQPIVLPTAYGRLEDSLVIHGASVSRMMRNLAQGIEICVTVTLVDGLVLGRSAFHHSMNYRSVVLFGVASVIADDAAKIAALRTLTEHIVPQRWNDVRPPNAQELKATTVLQLPICEASAKVRTGDPKDDEDDLLLPCWAGVIPFCTTTGAPIPDAQLRAGIDPPDYVANYQRP